MAIQSIKVSSNLEPFGRKPTLVNLQKAVGGSITLIHIDIDTLMIVNEEGLILGLPRNRVASKLYKGHIVGNVVILTDSDRRDFIREEG